MRQNLNKFIEVFVCKMYHLMNWMVTSTIFDGTTKRT